MGVEYSLEYAESPFQRHQGAVQGDVRMSGRLFILRSKKRDDTFWKTYG